MIVVCAWHEKYFGFKLITGEKPPLEWKAETSTICPECEQKMREETARDNAAEDKEKKGKMQIVKVRYFSETTQEASGREYSYFSEENLALGDLVTVPIRDHFGKAKVTAIDLPESDIAMFRASVKTIPAGSKIEPRAPQAGLPLADPPAALDNIGGPDPAEAAQETAGLEPNPDQATLDNDFAAALGDPAPCIDPEHIPDLGPLPPVIALVKVSTDDDLAVLGLITEANRLKDYAVARVIQTNDDLIPVTNDLAIIMKLKKALAEKQATYTRPIQAKLDAVRSFFKQITAPLEEADRITREKAGKYRDDADARAAEAKRIEDQKLKLAQDEAKFTGTGEFNVPLGTIQAPAPAPAHVRTESATLGGRDNWKARVIDFKALDDRYKLPNEQMLNALARSTKGQAKEPGVEFYNDRGITVRTK